MAFPSQAFQSGELLMGECYRHPIRKLPPFWPCHCRGSPPNLRCTKQPKTAHNPLRFASLLVALWTIGYQGHALGAVGAGSDGFGGRACLAGVVGVLRAPRLHRSSSQVPASARAGRVVNQQRPRRSVTTGQAISERAARAWRGFCQPERMLPEMQPFGG